MPKILISIKREKIEFICNLIGIVGTLLVLSAALWVQVFWHEEPCPLCLLQRVGLLAVALGFLMNIHFGVHPSHYGMIILSALYTSFVALRQIALNLSSVSGGFGSPMFGLHLYTWSFIIAIGIIIFSALIMSLERKYFLLSYNFTRTKKSIKWLFLLIGLLIGSNILTVMIAYK